MSNHTSRPKAARKGNKSILRTCSAVIPSFDELPDSALVRLAQLVRDPKRPTRAAPLPFSGATLWRKVAAGQFPKPIRVQDSRITAWRVSDVRGWLQQQCEVQ